MKAFLKLQYILLLFSCFLFSGCLSDGEETIALEQGEAKKMIRGRWILIDSEGTLPGNFGWKNGTEITFYGDGTYTDSSDGGEQPHRWIILGGGDGIALDDTDFGIDSGGNGRWRFHYPYGSENPTWSGGLKHEDGPEGYDKQGNKPLPEPEPEPGSKPEPEPQGKYLVKSIKYMPGYRDDVYTYTFDYYADGRIREFYDATTKKTYKYEYSSDADAMLNVEEVSADGKSYERKYRLDNKGRIKEEEYGYFFYSEDGFLYRYTDWHDIDCYYDWTTEGIWTKSIKIRKTICNNEPNNSNDSNIDLNPFLIYFIEGGEDWWLRSLAPFGFLGNKASYLISREDRDGYDFYFDTSHVSRNEQNLVSNVTRLSVNRYNDSEVYRTEFFDIEYKLSGTSDDETEELPSNINEKIIGVWYCIYQQWSEEGPNVKDYSESKTYEPSSKYVMAFKEDGTGYMNSGSDELFEIGCHGTQKKFNWYYYSKEGKNWIHTDVYDGQDYEITHLSSSSLTLKWSDYEGGDAYIIVGKFTK